MRVEITGSGADTDPADELRPSQPRRPGRVPVPAHLGDVSESSEPRGGLRLEVARTLEELERLRPAWDELPWQREEAAYEYFVDAPAHAAGRDRAVRRRRLERRPPRRGARGAASSRAGSQTALGYKRRLRPARPAAAGRRRRDRLRRPRGARRRSQRAIEDGARERRGRRGRVPAARARLRRSSASSAPLGGALARQPFIAPWTRRALSLPADLRRLPRLARPPHAQERPARRAPTRAAFGERLQDRDRARPGPGRAADRGRRPRRPLDLPARASAPASPTRPSSARSPRVGLEHGWLRGYLLYLDAQPDRLLALLALRRHDAAQDRRLRRSVRRVPRRHLPAHARDRGRLSLTPRSACSTSGPATRPTSSSSPTESRDERNVVVFAPTFRCLPHQRDADARSSRPRGSPAAPSTRPG